MNFLLFRNSRLKTLNAIPRDISAYQNMRYNTSLVKDIHSNIHSINLLTSMLPKLISLSNPEKIIQSLLMEEELFSILKVDYSKELNMESFFIKKIQTNTTLSTKTHLYDKILTYCYSSKTRFCANTMKVLYSEICHSKYKKNKIKKNDFLLQKTELNKDLHITKKHLESIITDIEEYWYSEQNENSFIQIALVFLYIYIVHPFQDTTPLICYLITILFWKEKRFVDIIHTAISTSLIRKYEDLLKSLQDILKYNNFENFFNTFLLAIKESTEKSLLALQEFIYTYSKLERFCLSSKEKYTKEYRIIIDYLWENRSINYVSCCDILKVGLGTTKKIIKTLLEMKILGCRWINKKEKIFFLAEVLNIISFFN